MATLLQPTNIDFDRIDTSRYEYVNGELRERPVPKKEHADVQGSAVELLGQKARAIGLRIRPELSLDKEDTPKSEWMTPDAVLVGPDASYSKRRNLLPPVLLAIEVMSPEQTIPEMMRKANDYLSWGVRNVWIIDPERQFAVLTDGQDTHWIWTGADLTIQLNEAEKLSIPFADLLA